MAPRGVHNADGRRESHSAVYSYTASRLDIAVNLDFQAIFQQDRTAGYRHDQTDLLSGLSWSTYVGGNATLIVASTGFFRHRLRNTYPKSSGAS